MRSRLRRVAASSWLLGPVDPASPACFRRRDSEKCDVTFVPPTPARLVAAGAFAGQCSTFVFAIGRMHTPDSARGIASGSGWFAPAVLVNAVDAVPLVPVA